MIRKTMYEVRSYRRTGPYQDEVLQGKSGPFETRGTAERAVIAFAQSGQCTRAIIVPIVVEESEQCPHPTSESCLKCTTPRATNIPEPLTGVPPQHLYGFCRVCKDVCGKPEHHSGCGIVDGAAVNHSSECLQRNLEPVAS